MAAYRTANDAHYIETQMKAVLAQQTAKLSPEQREKLYNNLPKETSREKNRRVL